MQKHRYMRYNENHEYIAKDDTSMTNQIEKFIVQYEQERLLQEINANKRILNGFIWFLAAVALVWILTVTGIFNVDKNMVTAAFLGSFLIFLPAFYLMFRGDVSKSWIKYFLITLLCIVCGIIISLLSFHATLLFVFPLIYAIQYREKRIIWFTYSINLLTVTVGMIAGFYCGLCDLNILLISNYTRATYLENITENSLRLPFNDNPVTVILVFGIIPTAIILFILSIMLQYTVISNSRDSLRIAQLTYYKDMDANTKVYNKNKYEEMIISYYPTVNRLAIIFFDLNNLKTVNDEHGHAMGDYIIETLATAIRSQSNDGRRAYRVGGDEFVMVLENPVAGEAELIIAAVKEQLRIHNETGPVAISTAAGFSYGKGSNFANLEKEADEKMYENKYFIKSQLS